MTPLAMQRLLNLLDAEQEDDVYADLTVLPPDLLALAIGDGPGTPEQVTALLGSPRLRHLMSQALAERRAAQPLEEESGNAEIVPLRLAAASQEAPALPWQQTIHVGPTADAPVAAMLTIRQGRTAQDLFLTLTLDPRAWLSEVAGLRLRLAEPGLQPLEKAKPQAPPQGMPAPELWWQENRGEQIAETKPGFVWLEGETDTKGEITTKWPFAEAGAPPWTRLKRLRKARLNLSFVTDR